ncbi:hypothetical protein CUL92_18470 [Salmonella enterica subsp. enterica serovar Telelkebir]|nr:hypothetical protein [Salmonella enterica subsp. enterica serovar Telelkebir]ECU9605489.1 hypothetical protein [Salmonella enterica subsp. enterica serovar Telelkebir]
MAKVTVHCPRCHSDDVCRHGLSPAKRDRFRCQCCRRVFQLTYSYEARSLFFGSDHGGECGALVYSLIGTCKLNGVDPECYLHYVLDVIADWPVNRVGDLLPWRVTLPA